MVAGSSSGDDGVLSLLKRRRRCHRRAPDAVYADDVTMTSPRDDDVAIARPRRKRSPGEEAARS